MNIFHQVMMLWNLIFALFNLVSRAIYYYDVSLVALGDWLMTSPSFMWHYPITLYLRRGVNQHPCIDFVSSKTKMLACVHGRKGHPNDFIPLINNLAIDDYLIVTLDLNEIDCSSLDEDCVKVNNALARYKDYEIHLVGLSRGGLVVVRYLTTMNDTRIKQIITIASPLQGTHIAKLLPESHISHQELQYQSPICQEIIQQMVHCHVPIRHIVPRYDYMIIPISSSKYETTDPSNIYEYYGDYSHAGIIFSPEIAEAINHWL